MYHEYFLSIVIAVENQSNKIEKKIKEIAELVAPIVEDYEIIIVDNGSIDNSPKIYRTLTHTSGLPNLQIFTLTKKVELDFAIWAGIENSLGDYVLALDPFADDIACLPQMLDEIDTGAEVVLASSTPNQANGKLYNLARSGFNFFFRQLNGIDFIEEAPSYRIINRRIVNFILQHPRPENTYRLLPATSGFITSKIQYRNTILSPTKKSWSESFEKSIKLLITSNKAPIRLVSLLSILGAGINLAYSLYVLGVALFKEDVAQGWVSLSLQQSGMFFLFSLVLLLLGEHILYLTNVSRQGPSYHIAQEFTSAKLHSRNKLNLEESL